MSRDLTGSTKITGPRFGVRGGVGDPLLRAANVALRSVMRQPRLNCLIYHRVLASPDPLIPDQMTAETFDWQMRMLAAEFEVMPLTRAVRCLEEATLPARAACVTLDDGYADNHEVALPILKKHRIPACIFVATGFLDHGCMWNDVIIEAIRRTKVPNLDLQSIGLGFHPLANLEERRAAVANIIEKVRYLPMQQRAESAEAVRRSAGCEAAEGLMLRRSQVIELVREGMEIGAHTINHPILSQLPPEQARQEIVEGKSALEGIIGSPVELFAYPNGLPKTDYSADHVHMVRDSGFKAAVSTARGSAQAGADLYQIPRFTPWDPTPERFLFRLLRNALNASYAVA